MKMGLKLKTKLLSIEEAEARLPLVNKVMIDIRNVWGNIVQLRTKLELIDSTMRNQTTSPPQDSIRDLKETEQQLKEDLHDLVDKINRYIGEIEEIGGFVQEFKRGVVSFPTLYLGRKVFIVWTPEDGNTIKFWHELDESYNERSTIGNRKDFLEHKASPFGDAFGSQHDYF